MMKVMSYFNIQAKEPLLSYTDYNFYLKNLSIESVVNSSNFRFK